MIALMYPFKMDKNITTEMSNLYTEVYKNFNPNKPDPKQVAAQAKQEQNRQQSNDPSGMKNRNIGGAGGDKNMMKNSFEPEGEMVDEMSHKAPRKQKGAMAYDGPNKERSEAADRVLAKTKAKKKKMNEGAQEDAVDQIMGGGKRDAQKDAVKQYVKYSSKNKKMKKEGKYRTEWEDMKLNEMLKYRSQFDNWLLNILEEGYDIERWTDDELLDTFIDENNLWESRESVDKALLSREDEFISEEDKKGKGSGKKDACYKKVKASAKVWPSAYASGRLVQCRKKGAANYGNSKEDFSNWRDELGLIEG